MQRNVIAEIKKKLKQKKNNMVAINLNLGNSHKIGIKEIMHLKTEPNTRLV